MQINLSPVPRILNCFVPQIRGFSIKSPVSSLTSRTTASTKDSSGKTCPPGKLIPGQKVVMVEDLISTGGSSLKAAEAVRSAGGNVVGMAAIFTYGFAVAQKNFDEAGIALHCLSDYQALTEAAMQNGYIPESAMPTLAAWRQSPETWKV